MHTLSTLSRFLQVSFGRASNHIFAGIKQGEVFPDDFLCAVAVQTLGADIPTDYVAPRIHLEKRVFLNALDKQTKALLALAQSVFGMLAVCDIFESNTHETGGQRKDLDGVNTLPYARIPIRDLSQVSWLPSLKRIKAAARNRCLQELREFSQRPATKILERRPSDGGGGGVEVNDSETSGVLRMFKLQDNNSQRKASHDLQIKRERCFCRLGEGRFCSMALRPGSSARSHFAPSYTVKQICSARLSGKHRERVTQIPRIVHEVFPLTETQAAGERTG